MNYDTCLKGIVFFNMSTITDSGNNLHAVTYYYMVAAVLAGAGVQQERES